MLKVLVVAGIVACVLFCIKSILEIMRMFKRKDVVDTPHFQISIKED
jgi:hypothetical protein